MTDDFDFLRDPSLSEEEKWQANAETKDPEADAVIEYYMNKYQDLQVLKKDKEDEELLREEEEHDLPEGEEPGDQVGKKLEVPDDWEPEEGQIGERAWISPSLGWGKDGWGWYVNQHPTHYNWTSGARRLIEKYINHEYYKYSVWANTYRDHPPGWWLDSTSVDFWDWGGRAVTLNDTKQYWLTKWIYNDTSPPYIRWMISNGRMWVRGSGWQSVPWGPAGSDAGHWNHIHVTYSG